MARAFVFIVLKLDKTFKNPPYGTTKAVKISEKQLKENKKFARSHKLKRSEQKRPLDIMACEKSFSFGNQKARSPMWCKSKRAPRSLHGRW